MVWFLLLLWFAGVAVSERVVDGLFAEYHFTQCECDGAERFQASEPSPTGAPDLILTGSEFVKVGSCPTIPEFDEPATQGFSVTPNEKGDFALFTEDGSVLANSLFPNGFTMEHWVKPQGLFERVTGNGRSISLAHLGGFEGEGKVFGCGLELDFTFPNRLHLVVGYFFPEAFENVADGGFRDFLFDQTPKINLNNDRERPIHAVCGVNIVNNKEVYFGCLNGLCQTFNTNVEVIEFPSDSHLEILKGGVFGASPDTSAPADFQLVAFAFYEKALSLAEVQQNFADRTIFRSVPILRQPLRDTVFEDDLDAQLFVGQDFFFLSEFDRKFLTLEQFELELQFESGEFGVERIKKSFNQLSLSGFNFLEPNFYSSSDSTCSIGTVGDFLPDFTAIASKKGESCVSAPKQAQICIIEVNDKPVINLETGGSVVDQEGRVAFSFVPGSDVDDQQFGIQRPSGTMDGGRVRVISQPRFSGKLFRFEDGACSNERLLNQDTVRISNGVATMCYERGAGARTHPADSFTFELIDAANAVAGVGTNSRGTAFVGIDKSFSVCADEVDRNCKAEGLENQATSLEISRIISDDSIELIRYKVLSLPKQGTLSIGESSVAVGDSFELASGATFNYLPNQDFVSNLQNSRFGLDGLGNSVCGNNNIQKCPDEFEVEVSAGGDVFIAKGQIFVAAVDNELTEVLKAQGDNNVTVGLNKAVKRNVASLDPKGDLDFFQLDVTLTVTNGVGFKLEGFDGTTTSFSSLQCSSVTEFCEGSATLNGFPSEINNLLRNILLIGSELGPATLTVTAIEDNELISDESTQIIQLEVVEIVDDSSTGVVVGVVVGIAAVAAVGFVLVRYRKATKDQGSSLLEAPAMPAPSMPAPKGSQNNNKVRDSIEEMRQLSKNLNKEKQAKKLEEIEPKKARTENDSDDEDEGGDEKKADLDSTL